MTMTDLTLVQELTEVIQLCLTTKMRQAHDASTKLTIDIARSLATNLEVKCNEYTNAEIGKLLGILNDNSLDLSEFRVFINEISSLLDGDPESEGYQVFRLLTTDVSTLKETSGIHTQTLSEIKTQISQINLNLMEHNNRLTTLENQESPAEIKDDMVNLIEEVFESACIAVSERLQEYRSNGSTVTLQTLRDELSTTVTTIELLMLESGAVLMTGAFKDTEMSALSLFVDGTEVTETVTVNFEKKIMSALLTSGAEQISGKPFNVQIFNPQLESEFSGLFPSGNQYPHKLTFN